MSTTITYYFALTSTWAYMGHEHFVALARRHGAVIDYRPLPLHDLFHSTGGLTLAERGRWRQNYRLQELGRWGAELGKTFNLRPAHWPVHNDLGDRVVLAILARGLDPHPAIARYYGGIWEREEDLNDPTTLARLTAEAGLDADGLLAEADLPHVRDRYRENLQAAMDAGVFGAPSFVLDGEVFWGQDRLPFLDKRLAERAVPA